MRELLSRAALAGAILCGLWASPVVAQTQAQKVPMESFFKLPQFIGAMLNPSASHLAYIREVDGRWNLVSMDVASRKLTSVAGYDRADVVEFHWLNDRRLMFRLGDARVGVADNRVHGWYAADLDGGKLLTLSEGLVSEMGGLGPNRGLPARAWFYSRARSGDPDDFIAVQYAESPFRSTLLRINSRSGQRALVEPGGLTNVVDWALDWKDVPRAAVTRQGDRQQTFIRDDASTPWRKVGEGSVYDNAAVVPVRFDKAGALFVSAYQGNDTASIYRFDWAKGAPEPKPFVTVKDYDVSSGLLFDKEGKLIGVRYEADQEGSHWLDPAWKTHQETVDAALAGRVNRLSGVADGPILVRSYSDASPPRYFLYEPKAKKLSLLGNSMPWIDEKTQARSDVIRYAARDGLTIPALLTLPRGAEAKNLPLVLLAHGGPNVRGIDWEWNRERQFLASRGYAILEPDFRGSLGHGWKLFRSGWRQWGLAMQDDLADGVQELVKRGMVDKDRVCIAGASYGGYATVMGLIKHPEVYKCGISWVGVTDIDLLFSVGWSDLGNSAESRLGMTVLIGDRDKDKEQFRATSAIAQAARLKAPLLLAYGGADVRVPYDHGQKLHSALRPHNDKVEYIEYAVEGHGWWLLKTNLDFWTRAEKLLATTIGK
ncbi:MAG TPA: prolyl oligopeptidase family serine peptidase [Caldimonas sp.]|jgi:dipeptidyl aminopeptidase/acylaminoacyl peptidase|nr:prolyl oligopeptidase family serine peptidase [Caldimonas sp.]HEX2541856.1 prolyl oligopeptidase family serine peptidase [Caldimonas sp.]